MGDNGLFSIAKKAAKEYKDAQEKELAGLDLFDNTVNDTLDELDGKVVLNGKWSNKKQVNMPKIANTGLTAVIINENETAGISAVSEEVETANKDAISVTSEQQQDESWYSYDALEDDEHESQEKNHWANAVSKDGSMWVWIPRFAYKITPKGEDEEAGKIDVVFLKGTTDEPAEKSSEGVTVNSEMIIRAKDITDETDLSNKYIVHPAFTDESKTEYANGGWDKEIPGFWMAKFEAGYVDADKAIDSPVGYSATHVYDPIKYTKDGTNYYGKYGVGTKIKYPTFQANRPSFNFIPIADAYDLCKSIGKGKEIYDLTNVDSHLIKDSEWGATVYLTHSKYGKNGQAININNVSLNGENAVYAVTGYAGVSSKEDQVITTLNEIKNETQKSWKTKQGQTASTTGNVYGIYDINGGLWEWTAGYIATDGVYQTNGRNLKGESTKYKVKYEHSGDGVIDGENYTVSKNVKRKGEAIWETSVDGISTNFNSWGNGLSAFLMNLYPFFNHGSAWYSKESASMFSFSRGAGFGLYDVGFRAVLITE